MELAVVPCALVPATPCNQHHPSPRNRARRTPLTPSVLARPTPTRSRPLKPPRPSPPRTPVRQSCPAAGCQRATPPPAGHARRPETRQAPRARAARTCFRRARSWCRSHGACRCPMRPRTCQPMQSTPTQPPQPRPSHPPHPVSPGPAHAAKLPTAGHARRPETRQAPRSRPLPPSAASRVQAASAACLLSLPHTRPRAARTCLRWCRPLRLVRACRPLRLVRASRRTTRPCRSQWQTCACPCPAAASPFLPTVRDEFARG
jgi:hypothetical protein